LVQIICILHYVILATEAKGLANLLTPVLYIITAMAILWLMNYDRLKGVFSSGLLFMFWLLVSLASIPDIVDHSVKFHQQVSHPHEHFHINHDHLSRSNQCHYGLNRSMLGSIFSLHLVHLSPIFLLNHILFQR